MNWRQRSYEKELLDGIGIPFGEIRKNMAELDTINKWLGGHGITLMGMRKMMAGPCTADPAAGLPAAAEGPGLHICEIGCGGGDNLREILLHAGNMGWKLDCTGIDINPDCTAYARLRQPGVRFITSDYREVVFSRKPDIIFSSLFCHHFNDTELAEQLQWMQANSRLGFFVNDLHRHPLAWAGIGLLTFLFSRSRLVKHDAPLSVKRGFSRRELETVLSQAGITDYELEWRWAFRWLLTVKNKAIAGS